MNNDTHRTQHPAEDERPFRTGLPARGRTVPAALIPATLRGGPQHDVQDVRSMHEWSGGAVIELGPVGSGKSNPLNPLAVVTSNKTELLPGSDDDGQVL